MRAGWLAGGGEFVTTGRSSLAATTDPTRLKDEAKVHALLTAHALCSSNAIETNHDPDSHVLLPKDRRRSFVVQSHSISSQDACVVLNDCLNNILNAERRGKRQVLIRPSSKVIIRFLTVMQKHGYIDEFEYIDDHRSGKIVVQLNGRINKCGVVSPRFNVPLDQIENWVDRLMPARSFGIIILTTSAGIMDHEEARRKHVAGKILGYVF
ncbi:hypothetical protein H4Q26_001994 [Puccinia striiformis f. sp. tritici PST-130]|nr:hypothetical protein H4Q26_001994 [Puccinia striiformis f. sp. tritici PST-130]